MSAATSRYAFRRALFSRRMGICLVTGFISGLPLFLLLNLVPAWLRDRGVSLAVIGLMALAQIPYAWKFLWSPFLDRYALPRLGRRRGWILLLSFALIALIGVLGSTPPTTALNKVIALAVLLAAASATLDIVVDAYRREILADEELGLGNALHINAYRLAGLVPGALGLYLADRLPWPVVFWLMAAFMLIGVALALFCAEPQRARPPATLKAAVVEPFREFIQRLGWRGAAWVAAFIICYKLGDALCTALATPFYLDLGFSKSDIGLIAKNAGLWPAVAGGLLGGLWMLRLGINRALWLFGAAQALSILGFAWLAAQAPLTSIGAYERAALATVIGLEALGVGLGSAAFVAFIAKNSHPAYTATQIALLTSLMALPRTAINASAGFLVLQMGWTRFFLLCFALALPGLVLLMRVAPWPKVQIRAEDAAKPA